jgi:putative cell wall-binding protein/uncharacterized protein YvpB
MVASLAVAFQISAPTAEAAWTVSLSPGSMSVSAGQSVTLTATTNQDVGPTAYGLYIKDLTNGTQKNCSSGTSCSWTVSYTGTTHSFVARVGMFDGTGTQVTSSTTTITWGSGSLPFTISLSPGSMSVASGQNVTLTATTNQDVGPTPYGLYIVDLTNGTQHNCSTGTTCSWTVAYSGAAHSFVARVGMFDGTGTQVTSSTTTITWGGSWTVSLSPGSQTVKTGQYVTLTATANADVGSSIYGLYIVDTTNGLQQNCATGTTCSWTVAYTSATHSFVARVGMFDGTGTQVTSSTTTIGWTGAWTVSLSPVSQSVAANQSVTLTATANGNVGNSIYGLYIVDTTTGQQHNCSTGTSCSWTVAYAGATHSFVARVGMFDGSGTQATSSTTTITWTGAWTVSLSPGSQTVAAGQYVTLTATASGDVGASIYGLYIVDTTNGQQHNCETGTTCSWTVTYTGATHSFVAHVGMFDGTQTQATSNTTTIVWSGAPAWTVSLSPASESVAANQNVTLIAVANGDVGNSIYGLYIVDLTTGLQKDCSTGTVCTWVVSYTGATHGFVARVGMFDGTETQVTSSTTTIVWAGAPSSWTVTLTPGSESVAANQSVTLTATANGDVGDSIYGLYIVDTANGSQHNCSTGTTCSWTVAYSGATHSFVARVGMFNGTQTQVTSSTTTIVWSGAPSTWTVSLSPVSASVGDGQSVTLTATTNRDVGPTAYGLYIVDLTNGSQHNCNSGTTCSWPVAYTGATHSFVARVGMFDGTDTQVTSSTSTIAWGGSSVWTVSLSPESASLDAYQSVTLTATANQDVGPTAYGLYIVDLTNASQHNCSSGTTCSWTVSHEGTTHQFVARIGMFVGTQTQATSSTSTIVWAERVPGSGPNLLDVPFQSQWDFDAQNGGNDCGPASLTMVLHYYGKPVQFADVSAATNPGHAGMDFESYAAITLLDNNDVDYVRNDDESILNMSGLGDIQAQIDAGHPVVILVNNDYGKDTIYAGVWGMVTSESGEYHIIVVTGYDDAYVYINDPLAVTKLPGTELHIGNGDEGYGKDYALPVDDFETAAKDAGWYGAAVIADPGPLDHLVLSPSGATIAAGGSQTYVATGFDAYDNNLGDVTSATTFTIGNTGSCSGASCTSTLVGDHTITGTSGSATGTTTLHVTPAAATHFTVVGLTSPRIAGATGSVTVRALDAYGNTATGYAGTVHFISTDPAAVLPVDHAFVAGDNGLHTFSVTLNAAGTHSVTARDTVTFSITGTQSGIVVQATLVRYGTNDKYATAAAVSANTFGSPCHCTAYIAFADNFPDALAGAAAAGTVKGPMLFVATSGAINSSTAAELTRLKPDRIVVLGSSTVISDAVFNLLKAYAPTGQTVRYYGSSRFATAAAVSSHTFAASCGCTAYIAYAMNFPDALAGAAAAGTVPGPVLLVATTGAIDASTAAELTRLKPAHIVVLGSTGVISDAVFNLLKAYAPAGQTVRYSGPDRYSTAVAISSNTFAANCGCVAYVAAGNDFNGGLAGAAAAGTIKGPVLLVPTTGALPASVTAELTRLRPIRIVVIGGTAQISDAVYNLLAAYAPS